MVTKACLCGCHLNHDIFLFYFISFKTNIGERATTKITKQQQGEQTTTATHSHPLR